MKLKEAMLNIGQQVDPIIIDKKHNVVLDGNHRMRVLQLIKVPNTVCQIVDYDDPKIEIGGWYPASEKITKKMFDDVGIKLEKIDFEVGKKEIENKKAAFMLHDTPEDSECYLISPGSYSLNEMISEQEDILKKVGSSFRYISDDLIQKEIKKVPSCQYVQTL